MIKALIFDFDGLITDTETTDYQAWKEIFEALGCQLPVDQWISNIGSTHFDPLDYLEAQLGPLDRETIDRQRRERDAVLSDQTTILPGVEGYLAQARQLGLKIGLASSSPHSWVDKHLQRLGLAEWFEVVCCRDDVNDRSKPDPAVYLAACSRLEIAPKQALALEDSANGAWAAKHAGLWCAVVPGPMTRQMNLAHADHRLHSLADVRLEALIAQVLRPKSNAERIRQFHHAVDDPPPSHPVVPSSQVLQLRRRLIEEEYAEVTAVFDQLLNHPANEEAAELAPLIHELADLLYVTYGAIVACGVDPDAVFAEVHRANLLKAGGPRREDGKILKPPGWQPANVQSILLEAITAD